MRVPNQRDQNPLEVKMTPMIDVVFLLLIFFVWTSSFELPEFDLPSSIAEPPDGSAEVSPAESVVEPFDEIIIRLISEDDVVRIELNGKTIAGQIELSSKLRQILSLGVQPPVIVDPDDRVTMSDAVAAYDSARSAGAERVLFAVRSDPATTAPGTP